MIRIRSKTDADDGLDMTPLIDCVFNLLLFFVLAASFTIRGMSLDLPPAKETRSITGRIVEVRLFENGTYSVDDIPVSREELPYRLNDLVKTFRSRPGQLVLMAAPKAPVEALVYLVDQVRRQGGEKLMVATSIPKEE